MQNENVIKVFLVTDKLPNLLELLGVRKSEFKKCGLRSIKMSWTCHISHCSLLSSGTLMLGAVYFILSVSTLVHTLNLNIHPRRYQISFPEKNPSLKSFKRLKPLSLPDSLLGYFIFHALISNRNQKLIKKDTEEIENNNQLVWYKRIS